MAPNTCTNSSRMRNALSWLAAAAALPLLAANDFEYQPGAESSPAWQLFVEGNYADAAKSLKSSDPSSNPDSSLLLGLAYDLGLGVEREPQRAEHWLENASRLGSRLASLALIEAALSDSSREAAIRRSAHGYYRRVILGEFDRARIGELSFGDAAARSENIRVALGYNRQIALQTQDPGAYANVSTLLEDPANQHVPNVFRLSQYYWTKASQLGAAMALHQQASRFRYGYGVAKDQSKAIELYRQAVAKGRLESAIALGNLLAKSTDPQEVAEGLAILENAAIENGEEMQDLAEIYEDGDNTAKNPTKAKELNLLAASIGHAHAANSAAWYLNRKDSTQSEKAEAPSYYQLAASRGSYWGAYNHGNNLLRDASDEADLRFALRWLEQAARLENMDAAKRLVSLYQNGHRFLEKDSERAAHWMDWAIAHEDDEMIGQRLRLLSQEGARSDGKRAWQLARQALALGNLDAFPIMASMMLDPSSTYHDPEAAQTLIQSYGKQDSALLQTLYFQLLKTEFGKEAAWKIARSPDLADPSIRVLHQLAFPETAEPNLMEQIRAAAEKSLWGRASASLAQADSLAEVYRVLARNSVANEFRDEALAPFALDGRALFSGYSCDPSQSPLRRFGLEFKATIAFVVDPSGRAAQVEIVETSHPFAEALAKEAALLLRWEADGDPDSEPINARMPMVFRFH